MLPLDLSQHEVDDIVGKAISINGIEYELGEMIGTGKEGLVFTLRNPRTRLVQFIAKIYRHLPESPRYNELKEHLTTPRHFVQGVRMQEINPFMDSDAEDPYSFAAHQAYAETYECHGGLIQIQPLLPLEGAEAPPECYEQEMAVACHGFASGEFHSASQQFEDILKQNHAHTDAMFFRTDCLLALGDLAAAEALIRRAIELEPNDLQLYHRLAQVLLIADSATAACDALRLTLHRWPWDYTTTYVLISTAIDWGLLERAREELTQPLQWAPDTKSFRYLSGLINDGQSHAESRRERTAAARAMIDEILSATEVNPIDLWGKCIKPIYTEENDYWRIRFTRRRYKTMTRYGWNQWPFEKRGRSIGLSTGGLRQRLHPAEEFGFFPSATAFRHAMDLFMLGMDQETPAERAAIWPELLRRLYFVYESGSDYPGIPFGFPKLVRSQEYRHVTAARGQHIHWGWSVREGSVMLIDHVSSFEINRSSGRTNVLYTNGGEERVRELFVTENHRDDFIATFERELGKLERQELKNSDVYTPVGEPTQAVASISVRADGDWKDRKTKASTYKPHEGSSRLKPLAFAICSFLLCGYMIWLDWSEGRTRDYNYGVASSDWPSVVGRIINARVESERKENSSTRRLIYVPEVEYEYTVQQKKYLGRNYQFLPERSEDNREITRIVMELITAGEVQVFYEPNDPTISVLKPGLPKFRYGQLGMIRLFQIVPGGIGIACLVLLLVKASQRWEPERAPPK